MDYTLGDTLYWAFTTRAFATGVPTALAGSPTLEIYENDSVTPIVEGAAKLVLTQNLNSINGFNLATITATSGNGFEAGKNYHLIVKTGTVGGTSVVGEVVGRFTLNASAAFTRLGAPAGASVSADVAAVKVDTAAILVDTAEIGVAGAGLTNINLPDQTMNITGNLSGSVGSVTATVSANTIQISGSTAAADALEESAEALGSGTVDGTGATTTAFLTSALTPDSVVNDQFNGRVLIFKNDTTTTALRGQATTISDWTHTSAEIGTFTVVALTTAPVTGDTFTIV